MKKLIVLCLTLLAAGTTQAQEWETHFRSNLTFSKLLPASDALKSTSKIRYSFQPGFNIGFGTRLSLGSGFNSSFDYELGLLSMGITHRESGKNKMLRYNNSGVLVYLTNSVYWSIAKRFEVLHQQAFVQPTVGVGALYAIYSNAILGGMEGGTYSTEKDPVFYKSNFLPAKENPSLLTPIVNIGLELGDNKLSSQGKHKKLTFIIMATYVFRNVITNGFYYTYHFQNSTKEEEGSAYTTGRPLVFSIGIKWRL